ncbi:MULTISPECIES: hypothetical protein [unclassified Streptomyces]|uniref:hypothetical protein n=1 Tax=unclassified Streptomyces TaxID=2593676 RepID=UPI002DDC882C|nr:MULTISPECIES: hypothetical protein [unclassified Streptomyces]WSC52372.1 hypothetical protein OG808_08975 [Streptomyces sp. NBC_01761]WSF83220.1 hypothetical protein OIE70_09065 [Streptomyces sp. NBC_01744]WSJ49686.1 hypothetical protein OG243_09090 [Streptomyces sp. NBC_01318]
MFTLAPALHNRLNTLHFTFRFLGMTVGSLVGKVVWAGGGCSPAAGAGAGVAATVAGLIVTVLRCIACLVRPHVVCDIVR